MIKNKKGNLEFSFAWIFAIIAGLFILSLAIYGVIKFINLEKTSQSTESAVDIGVLMNPLESSFEAAQRTSIKTAGETRIYTGCKEEGFFGKQILRISQKSYNEWSTSGLNISFQNKYVFSENPVEGRVFYLFSKPFETSFKVTDLIYLTSTDDKYCFVDAPNDIEEEIEDLTENSPSEIENFFVENCPSQSIKVCFSSGNCDIKVSENYVEKNGERIYYEGDALMYAAIFSNKEDYECQLSRLMKRTTELSNIYLEKSNSLNSRVGCDLFELNANLNMLKNLAMNFNSPEDITFVYGIADDLNRINKYGGAGECKLW